MGASHAIALTVLCLSSVQTAPSEPTAVPAASPVSTTNAPVHDATKDNHRHKASRAAGEDEAARRAAVNGLFAALLEHVWVLVKTM
eukprot:m.246810 g.246810  ORF g.246810 m.246810 type:complete len:86 (+) comp59074_c0_seq1:31-288(+)